MYVLLSALWLWKIYSDMLVWCCANVLYVSFKQTFFVLSFCPLRVVLSKGQVSTSHYRFLANCGGFVWAETQATILYNSKTSQPEAIVCLNFILRYLNKKWEHLLWPTTIRQYHTWGYAVTYCSIIVGVMQFGYEAMGLKFDIAFMQTFYKLYSDQAGSH